MEHQVTHDHIKFAPCGLLGKHWLFAKPAEDESFCVVICCVCSYSLPTNSIGYFSLKQTAIIRWQIAVSQNPFATLCPSFKILRKERNLIGARRRTRHLYGRQLRNGKLIFGGDRIIGNPGFIVEGSELYRIFAQNSTVFECEALKSSGFTA